MTRSSFVYVAPRGHNADFGNAPEGNDTLTLSRATFKPALIGSQVVESQDKRGANVIHSTDLLGEIGEVKQMMKAEGLVSANLIFNEIPVRVEMGASVDETVGAFLEKCGSRQKQFFELDTSKFRMLDSAVYAACSVCKLLNPAEDSNTPVRFKFRTDFVGYDTATVFKQDTPEEVFEQLKGKLWFRAPKGKLREPSE